MVDITAGRVHTCALTTAGDVVCWGSSDAGQLGYGNLTPIGDNEPPSSAGTVDVGGTVLRLYADGDHNCALLSEGGLRCWGNGGEGRLGYGNTNNVGDSETPNSVGDVPLF